MTQDQRELLMKDLSARLPYGVKVSFFNEDLTYHADPKTLHQVGCDFNWNYSNLEDEDGNTTIIELCKPYLFPLSSMTDEQRKEWRLLMVHDSFGILYHTIESFDYLYKNHIDIRGLIPMGLANDATGLNIY